MTCHTHTPLHTKFIFIYYKKNLIPLARGRRASTPRKKTRKKDKGEDLRKGKGSKQRVIPPTPPRTNDALIGDEEQNRK